MNYAVHKSPGAVCYSSSSIVCRAAAAAGETVVDAAAANMIIGTANVSAQRLNDSLGANSCFDGLQTRDCKLSGSHYS